MWALALLVLAGVVAIHGFQAPVRTLRGTVLVYDRYAYGQSPIANVEISAEGNVLKGDARSDFSGFFSVRLRPGVSAGQRIVLRFRHLGYEPLDVDETIADRLYIARMKPRRTPAEPDVAIKNLVIRYSVEATTATNIGNAVKVFEVRNTGNTPCEGKSPCSPDGTWPDGSWKATVDSVSLDAGDGNEFRNARVSCLAGPCPFTKIQADHFSAGGRTIGVSVLAWSDTVTFVLQAEVFRLEIGDAIRTRRPVVLGRALHFSLPQNAQGPSILAELNRAELNQAESNGELIVFPLSSRPRLSWADCEMQVEKSHATNYRCELKPGYAFK